MASCGLRRAFLSAETRMPAGTGTTQTLQTPLFAIAFVTTRFLFLILKSILMNNINMSDLIEKRKMAWEGMFYSIQRMDLLTIAISGAGIYTVLETIKYLGEKDLCKPMILYLSGIAFLASIVINFVSQAFGYFSHRYDYIMREHEINGDSKEKIDRADTLSNNYNKAASYTNVVGITSMLVGLTLIVIFFMSLF